MTVTYKGKGKVDASHKFWVWLFDTPNIGPGAMPIDQVALDKNGADAVFEAVAADKVWVAVAFDESGRDDGRCAAADGHTDRHPHAAKDGAPIGCGVRREGSGRADVRRFAAHAVITSR